MKKTLVFILVLGVCLSCASSSFAQNKIIRKTVKKVIHPSIAPAEPPKTATNEAVPKVPPPPPTAPAGEVETPKPEKGLFGWGINTDCSTLYLLNRTGQTGLLGVIAGRGDIIFSDPLLLGSKIGLAEDAVEYKVGLGLAYGNDISNSTIYSIPLFIDAVVYLKEGTFFGTDPYLGAGINYNLYGSGRVTGGSGSQIYAGTLIDFGFESGKTGINLGYNAIRAGSIRAAEGITISASQPFVL